MFKHIFKAGKLLIPEEVIMDVGYLMDNDEIRELRPEVIGWFDRNPVFKGIPNMTLYRGFTIPLKPSYPNPNTSLFVDAYLKKAKALTLPKSFIGANIQSWSKNRYIALSFAYNSGGGGSKLSISELMEKTVLRENVKISDNLPNICISLVVRINATHREVVVDIDKFKHDLKRHGINIGIFPSESEVLLKYYPYTVDIVHMKLHQMKPHWKL